MAYSCFSLSLNRCFGALHSLLEICVASALVTPSNVLRNPSHERLVHGGLRGAENSDPTGEVRSRKGKKACGHCPRAPGFEPKPSRSSIGGGRGSEMRPISVPADA
jgi:hypothetical protein